MRTVWRRVRHRLLAMLIDSISFLLRRLPRPWVPLLGACFGRFVGSFAWRANRRMEQRIQRAVPNPPSTAIIWADLGRRLFETLDAERQLDSVQLPQDAVNLFARAKDEGRGVLLATYHLGQWELMAGALARAGYPVTAIAAQRKPGPLQARLDRCRQRLGIQTLGPDGGARKATKILRNGGVVALFVDQNTRERGHSLPFLGHSAHTPNTFERLLQLTQSVPLLIWNTRLDDGKYRVRLETVDESAPMAMLTRRCEELVSQFPSQWVWLHDRWQARTKPPRTGPQNRLPSTTCAET